MINATFAQDSKVEATEATPDNKNDNKIDNKINDKIDEVLKSVSLPFIDLSCNISGSITTPIAKKLAKIQKIKLPSDDDEELNKILTAGEDCKNINDFLKYMDLPQSLLQTKKGITQSIVLITKELDAQGVLYAELKLFPQKHCLNGLTQDAAIKAAINGVKKAAIHTNLILCCEGREDTHLKNIETIDLAKKYLVKDSGVVAVEITLDDAAKDSNSYKEELTHLKDLDVPFIVNASGDDNIKMALDFGVKRLGGVFYTSDNALLERIIKDGIVLEMAVTSDGVTGGVTDMAQYPLKKLLDMGVKVTINTGYGAVCNTTLENEWDVVKKMYDLNYYDMEQIFNNAVDGANTNDNTKSALRESVAAIKIAAQQINKSGEDK